MLKTPYRVAILVASDKGAAGERVDESGPLIRRRMQEMGAQVAQYLLLPDDMAGLSAQLKLWCDENTADLILTSGGTGLSPRDQMPEATLAVSERLAPGIAEAIRAHSMRITPRGMLARGVAAVRGRTLIVNLPGSPKAVDESLDALFPTLWHGLDMLCQNSTDCARK